jgi:hypothetical protein
MRNCAKDNLVNESLKSLKKNLILHVHIDINDTKNFNEGTRFQIEPPGFDASEFSSFHTS